MITRWKLFLLPAFIGSIDVWCRIRPMFRTDLFYKRIENCATLHRNVGPQFSRTRLLVSFHNSSRLSSQLLINSANLKLMLIGSVSSSINRIDYSRKLIGKVKVNQPRLAMVKFMEMHLILISIGKYFLSIYLDKKYRKNIGLLHRHVLYWSLETRKWKMLFQGRHEKYPVSYEIYIFIGRLRTLERCFVHLNHLAGECWKSCSTYIN